MNYTNGNLTPRCKISSSFNNLGQNYHQPFKDLAKTISRSPLNAAVCILTAWNHWCTHQKSCDAQLLQVKLHFRTGKHALCVCEAFRLACLPLQWHGSTHGFFHSSYIKAFWFCRLFLRSGEGRKKGACRSKLMVILPAVSMRLSSSPPPPSPELWPFLWILLQFSAMGCIQSIKCKPKSFRDSVVVLELNTSIDSNPTSIDEASSVVLRYRTPHFRAQARLLVPPVAAKETWTIGWIQACNHMVFYNTYGDKGMWVYDWLFFHFFWHDESLMGGNKIQILLINVYIKCYFFINLI